MTRPLDPLPDETLDELERLEREATPGPWEAEPCAGDYVITYPLSPGDAPRVMFESWGPDEDADLAVAARNTLPSLLAEVRAVRAGRDATPDLRIGANLHAIRYRAPSPMRVPECIGCGAVGPIDETHRKRAAEPCAPTCPVDAAVRALAGRDARATPGTARVRGGEGDAE